MRYRFVLVPMFLLVGALGAMIAGGGLPDVGPGGRRPPFGIRPYCPRELRKRDIGGSGVYAMHVYVSTGIVRGVEIEQSTGVPELDRCAVEALKRWRFRPGSTVDKVRIPITFTPPARKK